MALVLVVDDEESIQRLLRFSLEREGFEVLTAGNGVEALKVAYARRPDLIVLDLMLPGMSGLDFLKFLRADEKLRETPVIILSCRGEEKDRVLGLETGADDYIPKPFGVRELIARVRAQLRRRAPEKERNRVVRGQLVIDGERLTVSWDGVTQYLTPKEFALLHFLATHPGRVFSREYLLDRIWGFNFPGDSRTVDVHIRYIRRKLEKLGAPPLIETVRGAGYRFRDDLE
jgi:two-component system alkaline phosphatase synthesis response regulator PhoP